MQQVFYVLHLRGTAASSGSSTKVLKIMNSGTSCTLETLVDASGVKTTLHPAPGDLAFLEAEVRMTGPEAFEGEGILTFGEEGEHALRFRSLHSGHLGPSAIPEVMAGTVGWQVTGGSGRFESAKGMISSTFTLTRDGELSEYQCGLLFLPE